MLKLHWLETDDPFPPTSEALEYPPGLLAAGASLDPDRLLDAYSQGIFPWFSPGEPLLWWTPDPRCVFFPEHFHLGRRLRRRLRNAGWTVSLDQAFADVIRACAEPRKGQPGTWISPAMIDAYERLFQRGHGHSVEIWHGAELVGGLYGLQLGRVFFGESMFSRVPDASKGALLRLLAPGAGTGIRLLDGQVESPHLLSLGAELISRARFERYLAAEARMATTHPGPEPARPVAELVP